MIHASAAAKSAERRLRDLVDVRPHPTVVRLEHLDAQDNDWIASSYHLTRDVRNHLHALREVLGRPAGCGAFLIGQYGSGKSHFLAYLTKGIREGAFPPQGLEARAVSLLNHRSPRALEDILCEEIGVSGGGQDRRATWGEVSRRHAGGLLLVIDELSEFLRSKPDRRSFNEDIRFLQFLGEWAQDRRFWVIAAMQEQIEHTGDLEHAMYRKIKDRFPLRLLLTPAHVKDILSECILVKKEGFEAAVDGLIGEIRGVLPPGALNLDDLRAIYPIHPATLELLEEVRDRFSQARGVVDFAVTQLRGDPARGIAPFLDRPWGCLLAPDAIIDHFQDLLEVQPEFLPLSQQLFPYYRKHLREIFETDALADFAWRVLKLLALVHLSPARKGLTAPEAVAFLLFRAARIDPEKNRSIVERVLRRFVDKGRYVAERGGAFAISLEDDGGAALERFIEREKSDLRERGEGIFEMLVPHLGDEDFSPFALPRERWLRRSLKWRFHERSYSVWVGNEDPEASPEGISLAVRLPWGAPKAARKCHTLLPAPIQLGEEHLEVAALLKARERTWAAPAAKRLESRLAERLALFRGQARTSYLEGALINPAEERELLPRTDRTVAFPLWLDACAETILRRRYPAFERFAPSHGPLPKEAYRAFFRHALTRDLGDPEADEAVGLIREGYLVPMGLLRRKGNEYVIPESPQKNELVKLVLPLLAHQPAPSIVYEHLAEPIYGLVPDQVSLLLVYLLILGEIDIVKDKKSYREAFETLPNPILYDRLVPGCALAVEQIREVERLCEGLGARAPKQWTVLAQRQAARLLREAGQERFDRLRKLLLKLEQLGQARELIEKLREVLRSWNALEKGDGGIQSLQQLLFEIGSAARFLSTLSEMEGLPERIDGLLSEIDRLRHLLAQPVLARWPDQRVAIRFESIPAPPGLDRPDAVEDWVSRTREAYAEYKESYAKRHDAFWEARGAHSIWTWQPPRVAASRHLGLDGALRELQGARERATRSRCRGLGRLDFHPICACGFDGETSPVDQDLAKFDALRVDLERSLTSFFDQKEVRARLRLWAREGVELSPETLAYVEGQRPWPETESLELFDRYLAGVEVVKEMDPRAVLDLLEERTWDRRALLQGLESLLAGAADRVRFSRAAKGAHDPLLAWCAEVALRHGIALPGRLSAADLRSLSESLRPEWVSEAALRRLDELGFGDEALDRIAAWVINGAVRAPERREGLPGIVEMALEAVSPRDPVTWEELARLGERLYREHSRGMRVARERWLERLDRLARSAPQEAAPPLPEVLGRHQEAQWLIVDCLGLPLVSTLKAELKEMLPAWTIERIELALASETTTTDDCYRQLLGAGVRHPFEKMNCVDSLLHERFLPFDDMARLAAAELRASARNVRPRLDPARPLLVFADHGFRIAPDGRSYTHGGPSALERAVPVLRMAPR